jgi:hypothetical protein
MSLESHLQTALLLAAPERLPNLRLFRRNIVVAHHEGRTIAAGIKGQFDIYGIKRNGLHIEIELKSLGKKLNPDQKIWQVWCVEWNIPHVVLTGKKDETVNETVDRWCLELAELCRA